MGFFMDATPGERLSRAGRAQGAAGAMDGGVPPPPVQQHTHGKGRTPGCQQLLYMLYDIGQPRTLRRSLEDSLRSPSTPASLSPARHGRAARPPAFRPLYLQIKDLLVERLDAGHWRPGEAIPSELELAALYRVSQGTVRKAIDALAGDNL